MNVIKALEEKIRQAQLNNDVEVLDEIISDKLQFVVFDGSIATKEDDLRAHKQKLVLFHDIQFSEQKIVEHPSHAVVTVKAEIKGTAGGAPFHGFYRYGRVWAHSDGRWQLIAGNVTEIKNS